MTGAARGIGAAVAKRLARDGLAVAVIDLDEAGCATTVEAIRSEGGTALAIAADVADEGLVGDAVARVVAELGTPTVLINNAGVGPRTDLVEMTTEQWDMVLGVNLRGPFFLARAVAPYMIEAGWGRVVTMSSISAVGDAGRVDYASAKAGLIGFTKSLSLQLGRHGVTANAIAPGFVVSDMTRASARRLGLEFEEFRRRAAQSIPVGRVGQPEDIAHTASYLVSPEAGFVSGQVVYVAGGPVDLNLARDPSAGRHLWCGGRQHLLPPGHQPFDRRRPARHSRRGGAGGDRDAVRLRGRDLPAGTARRPAPASPVDRHSAGPHRHWDFLPQAPRPRWRRCSPQARSSVSRPWSRRSSARWRPGW